MKPLITTIAACLYALFGIPFILHLVGPAPTWQWWYPGAITIGTVGGLGLIFAAGFWWDGIIGKKVAGNK